MSDDSNGSPKKPEPRGLEEITKFLEKKRMKEIEKILSETLRRRQVIKAYKRNAS